MASQIPLINEPDTHAGPSSLPVSRDVSPTRQDSARTLRRPSSHGRLSRLMNPGRSRSGSSASQQETLLTAYAGDGIPSSGRSTPEQRRRNGKAAASSLLANDAKYKKFVAQVDKCLQAFESVNEWADFISFLSRLLKTLQMPSPPYGEIPRKLIVAKRLAQCLNPALPSGVHHRALDVYSFIFEIIGAEGLRRDLLIWSSGIFPFFQYAATSVRPILISIYERYYLPLGDDLRPATKAFILALLPGMEEETGDFFDKVLLLLSRVSEAISPSFFLQNIFLILISSPSCRLPALNYLSRRLVKSSDPDVKLDVGLVIRGVAAVLADENSLVRRGGLDLLLRILPLNGKLLDDAEETDRGLLVRAAVGVVLQRELSLSRRVYSWLLGPEESSELQMAYFKEHGLKLLASTLEKDMKQEASSSSDSLKPFKIFLSLLDRWEIGSGLSECLAIPVLEAIKSTADRLRTSRDEMIMTASAVYDAVEPTIIWRSFYTSLDNGQEAALIQWVLENIPQKDEEITNLHMPMMIEFLLDRIAKGGADRTGSLSDLQLCETMLQCIPTANFSNTNGDEPAEREITAQSIYSSLSNQVENHLPLASKSVLPRIVMRIFEPSKARRDSSSEAVLSILRMSYLLIDAEALALANVDSEGWTSGLIKLGLATQSFALVDATVSTLLKASQSPIFVPGIAIAREPHMSSILGTLFRYLRPGHSAYHVRVVELLWNYNQLAEIHTLENVISRQISSAMGQEKLSAIEAFGVLWRLTEDAMLPGEIFRTPLFMLLDALKSSDPEIQRIAETWMRCNLRSYFRILDPILVRLLDPGGYSGDVSTRAGYDLSSVNHLVESVATVFRFGGQGLSKACQTTEVIKSVHPTLAQRASMASPGSSTYLDLLVSTLLSLFKPPPGRFKPSESPLLLRVHSSTLEVLQLLVSRGDISRSGMESIKLSLLHELSVATKNRQCTLQSKMLHLLHSAINSTIPVNAKTHRRSVSLNENNIDNSSEDFERKLVQVIIDGISSPDNRPILQHWVDFVLMTATSLQVQPILVHAVCDCLSVQLRHMMVNLKEVYSNPSSDGTTLSDAEPVMIISGLERLVSLPASGGSIRRTEDGRSGNEGGSGILGLMSGVFIADTSNDEKPRFQMEVHLNNAIQALLVTWAVTSSYTSDGPSHARPSRQQNFSRIRQKAKKVLEKLFKSYANAVVGGCISAWAEHAEDIDDDSIFDCIDSLAPSAQKVVEIITEGISGRQNRATEGQQLDPANMSFLEAYITRLEAPIAVQIWSTLFGFARELLASSTTPAFKAQLYPLLRCLTALCQIVITTSALEDRRLRRELQDVYPKVLDAVVGNVSRAGEIITWARSSVDEKSINGDRDEDRSLLAHLSDAVIPNLRSFLVDQDRISAACVNIFTNVVLPALRQHHVDSLILRIVIEMTKLPSAAKAWRSSIGDAFNDSRFFRIKPEEVALWKPLICSLMETDRERLPELLSRITAAPSANIFTNREQEMILRSSNLRRLSFVLLAAEENHYLAQLPAIQEKLVDILRTNVVSPRVHSEVYLTLRVLMCRISPQHLTNFWPVILAELLRVFETLMDDIPPDGSESLQLALAACKFLDLLLVIQSEDFQIHQWMFVTDTTDAAFPPEDFTPEAIMDTLSEILSEVSHGIKADLVVLELDVNDHSILRRPRLTRVRNISSLRQLQPFFSRASIDTFEGVYSNAGVDWNIVEEGLSAEIFTINE